MYLLIFVFVIWALQISLTLFKCLFFNETSESQSIIPFFFFRKWSFYLIKNNNKKNIIFFCSEGKQITKQTFVSIWEWCARIVQSSINSRKKLKKLHRNLSLCTWIYCVKRMFSFIDCHTIIGFEQWPYDQWK